MNEFIFFTFFFTVLICLICFLLSPKGREFLHGGKIIKEWDSLKTKNGIVSSSIKISTIEITPTLHMVGFEVSQSGFGFYNMSPITFPASEAFELGRVLNEAATSQSNGGKRTEFKNSIKTVIMKIYIENTSPTLRVVSIKISRSLTYGITSSPIHLPISEALELAGILNEAATFKEIK